MQEQRLLNHESVMMFNSTIDKRYNGIVDVFNVEDLEGIENFSGWFAKSITISIMEDDYIALKELCNAFVKLYSDLDYCNNIEFNKNFYLGYCYAYYNIASKLLNEHDNNTSVKSIIYNVPYIKSIIKILKKHGYLKGDEIASHLNLSLNKLETIVNDPDVRLANIINMQTIDDKTIYSLTQRGKQITF